MITWFMCRVNVKILTINSHHSNTALLSTTRNVMEILTRLTGFAVFWDFKIPWLSMNFPSIPWPALRSPSHSIFWYFPTLLWNKICLHLFRLKLHSVWLVCYFFIFVFAFVFSGSILYFHLNSMTFQVWTLKL